LVGEAVAVKTGDGVAEPPGVLPVEVDGAVPPSEINGETASQEVDNGTAVCANSLPLRTAPTLNTTAVASRMVPTMVLPVPRVIWAATCKKAMTFADVETTPNGCFIALPKQRWGRTAKGIAPGSTEVPSVKGVGEG
jgi:hypothetical protein